jgi:hypothetical protein
MSSPGAASAHAGARPINGAQSRAPQPPGQAAVGSSPRRTACPPHMTPPCAKSIEPNIWANPVGSESGAANEPSAQRNPNEPKPRSNPPRSHLRSANEPRGRKKPNEPDPRGNAEQSKSARPHERTRHARALATLPGTDGRTMERREMPFRAKSGADAGVAEWPTCVVRTRTTPAMTHALTRSSGSASRHHG